MYSPGDPRHERFEEIEHRLRAALKDFDRAVDAAVDSMSCQHPGADLVYHSGDILICSSRRAEVPGNYIATVELFDEATNSTSKIAAEIMHSCLRSRIEPTRSNVQGANCNLRNTRRLMMPGLVPLLLSCASLAMCQGQAVNASTSASASKDTYRSATTILAHPDLVLIPVTVTDRGGSVVTGLQKEHFTLFEDKAQQVITHFASEEAPASIGFVFDTSDSMARKLRKAREAVSALLNEANKDDEFFLVQFNTLPELVVPMTSRREDIRRGVERLQVSGATALLDAVTLAMEEMKNACHTRKAIIIIPDGEDNSSRCSMNEFKAAVREGDVLIYAIGIDSGDSYSSWRPEDVSGSAFLREITKQTGGRLIEVHKLT